MSLLVIMVGPSGAGKTTIANSWSEQGMVHVSSDSIRADLYGSDWHSPLVYPTINQSRVFDIFDQSIVEALSRDYDVVADATHLSVASRRRTRQLAYKHTQVVYFVIDRPLKDKLADAGWRSDELIRKHHHKFRSKLDIILRGDKSPNVNVLSIVDVKPEKIVWNLV